MSCHRVILLIFGSVSEVSYRVKTLGIGMVIIKYQYDSVVRPRKHPSTTGLFLSGSISSSEISESLLSSNSKNIHLMNNEPITEYKAILFLFGFSKRINGVFMEGSSRKDSIFFI